MNKFNNKNTMQHQKLAYFSFNVLGLCMAIFFKDYALGASMIVLSIIFYPLQVDIAWPNKSLLQKSLILSHLVIAVVFAVLALLSGVRS